MESIKKRIIFSNFMKYGCDELIDKNVDESLKLNFIEKKEYVRNLVNKVFLGYKIKGDDVVSRMKYFGNIYHNEVGNAGTKTGINNLVQNLLERDTELLQGNLLNENILEKKTTKNYKSDLDYLSYYAETLVINKLMEDLFNPIPKNERFIFLPHCLRPRKDCLAKDYIENDSKISYENCSDCGNCSIGNDFIKIASNLGYDKNKIAIVGGGEEIPQIISEYKPKAIVGVACPEDLRKFMVFYALGSRDGVNLPPGKMILLSSLGCKNTSFERDDVEYVLKD
jgi:hypothetical protein